MALTDKNKLQVAYKKLLGKSQTNTGFLPAQEVPTSFQAASSFVFGEVVPTDETSADASNVVEKVTLSLEPIGQYVASVDNGTGTISGQPLGFHSFALKLQQEITINNITYSAQEKIKDHNELQIVPDIFGLFYYPSFFNNGTKIDKNSVTNWFIDPFSGILWVQDLNAEFDGTTSTANLSTVEAYIYTGKFLEQKIAEVASTSGASPNVIESAEGTGDSIDAKAGIRFEDEPESDPQPDYAAAMLYYEGELQFYTNQIVDDSQYKILHLSRDSTVTVNGLLTSENITAFGQDKSIQFNDGDFIAGSDEAKLSWNKTTETLSVENIEVTSGIQANTIGVNTITTQTVLIEGDSTLPAAGANTQIQFNNQGNLGASEELFFEETSDTSTLKVSDSPNGNSISLFINKSQTTANQTSGLLLINSGGGGTKELLVNSQYEDTTQIYKIDSDLPLYINSQTQNKITAGSSKIDMSAGQVEIWPDSSNYLKIGTEQSTIKTSLTDFKIGVQSNNTDYALLKYEPSGGDFKIYLSNETLESLNLNIFGLNVPKYLAVGSEGINGFASFYFNQNEGGTSSTLNLANFSNMSNEYANIKYERNNSGGKLSFAIESTTPQVEIKKEGIYSSGYLLLSDPFELLEQDIVKYYDSDLFFEERKVILTKEIPTNTKFLVEIKLYFSWQNGAITYYNSNGDKIFGTDGQPDPWIDVLFNMPTIQLEVDGLPSADIFNSYSLFENKAESGTYIPTSTNVSTSTISNKGEIYETPFPSESLVINKFTALSDNKFPNIGGNNSISDLTIFSCKFFIEIKEHTQSNVNLCVSAYSSPPIEQGTALQNNLAHNFSGPGALEYGTTYKSGFCFYKGSHMKISVVK